MRIGYFVEIEKTRNPHELIDHAVYAEKKGFDAVWATDHFHPWVHTDAGCGFTWSWISACAEHVKTLPIGTAVTSPLLRYHPAIVAQAFATLGIMYPNRIFLALGAGEAMNEVPLGYEWPNFKERHARYEEAILIIKALWTKDFVNFRGKYYRVRNANLYTKPDKPIPLIISANGPVNAELAGKYGDAFLTMENVDVSFYKQVLFPAVERGARSMGRDASKIPKCLEVNVAYDEDYDKALQASKRWGTIMMPLFYKLPIADPREVEATSVWLDERQLAKVWIISSDPEEHIRRLERYVKEGFQDIHTCNWGLDEYKYIDMYAKHVIPYFKSNYS